MLPAKSLRDIYTVFDVRPLLEADEYRAFYRPMSAGRGYDPIGRMRQRLEAAHQGRYFRAILMGHPGVGKSTELTRLRMEISGLYETLRIRIGTEIDPIHFDPYAVVLIMLLEVLERTAAPLASGGAGAVFGEQYLREVLQWLGTETSTEVSTTAKEATASAEAGTSWTRLLGLSARIKGEIKYAGERKKEVVERRIKRLSELVHLSNRIFDEANNLLRQSAGGKEWLFIIEDFEKFGSANPAIESFFIDYGGFLKDLRTHIVLTAPIHLRYSERGIQLPIEPFILPDTPVFDRQHEPHHEGRTVLQEVLHARIDLALFSPQQAERLIVASGGNLRDLFTAVVEAADNALSRGASAIEQADVSAAIKALRNSYVVRLGDALPYRTKMDRLLSIYRSDAGSEIPDPVLDSLLRSRCVQEFNGEKWFGLPPMIVNILKSNGELRADDPGGAE